MRRLCLIDHLETYLEAAYFDLLVASLARFESFPYSFGLAELAERCTVEVRWRAMLCLAEQLEYKVDSCPLHDLDLLTTNFVGSPRLSVWLVGLAELMAVPLGPAYMPLEKFDSALVYSVENPMLVSYGLQGKPPVTAQMMAC